MGVWLQSFKIEHSFLLFAKKYVLFLFSLSPWKSVEQTFLLYLWKYGKHLRLLWFMGLLPCANSRALIPPLRWHSLESSMLAVPCFELLSKLSTLSWTNITVMGSGAGPPATPTRFFHLVIRLPLVAYASNAQAQLFFASCVTRLVSYATESCICTCNLYKIHPTFLVGAVVLLLLALSVIFLPTFALWGRNVVTDVCKIPQNETDTQHVMAEKEQCWYTSALEDQSLLF